MIYYVDHKGLEGASPFSIMHCSCSSSTIFLFFLDDIYIVVAQKDSSSTYAPHNKSPQKGG